MQTVATSSLWVVLGEHNTTTSSETNLTLRMEVEEIVVHTNKLGNPDQVDIALIKVKDVIDLNIYTPICLPDADFNVRKSNVILAGKSSCDYYYSLRNVLSDIIQAGAWWTALTPRTTRTALAAPRRPRCR